MKQAPSSIGIQEASLVVDEARLVREKDALSECEARLSTQRQRVANVEQSVVEARNALGKAKLTAAIELVEKVFAESPAGSAAKKDISGMLERLMVARMQGALDTMGFVSPWANRPSTKYPPGAAYASQTAKAIDNMTTAVGAGQPRQAKPSPYVPKAGDKVRLLRSWYHGADEYVGTVMTVADVSQGRYFYTKELSPANCAASFFEPAGAFRVGDKVRYIGKPGWCGVQVGDVLTVSLATSQHGDRGYLRCSEMEAKWPGHNQRHSSFEHA